MGTEAHETAVPTLHIKPVPRPRIPKAALHQPHPPPASQKPRLRAAARRAQLGEQRLERRAALRVRDHVDLVDDDRLELLQAPLGDHLVERDAGLLDRADGDALVLRGWIRVARAG